MREVGVLGSLFIFPFSWNVLPLYFSPWVSGSCWKVFLLFRGRTDVFRIWQVQVSLCSLMIVFVMYKRNVKAEWNKEQQQGCAKNCVTWHGPKTLSSLYSSTRIGCGSTAVQCTVFATCSSLLTRERTQLSTRRDTAVLLFFHPSLVTCTTVPRAYSNPRCRLRPMLKPSDIANSAPTRTIQGSENLNSAPTRTIQHYSALFSTIQHYSGPNLYSAGMWQIVLVRVFSPVTYPHYRGTSTVLLYWLLYR